MYVYARYVQRDSCVYNSHGQCPILIQASLDLKIDYRKLQSITISILRTHVHNYRETE